MTSQVVGKRENMGNRKDLVVRRFGGSKKMVGAGILCEWGPNWSDGLTSN
jgi:hypothetical protein